MFEEKGPPTRPLLFVYRRARPPQMSQFGIMFFDDPVAAFTNIRRRLRPGARMTFACGQSRQKNRWLPP